MRCCDPTGYGDPRRCSRPDSVRPPYALRPLHALQPPHALRTPFMLRPPHALCVAAAPRAAALRPLHALWPAHGLRSFCALWRPHPLRCGHLISCNHRLGCGHPMRCGVHPAFRNKYCAAQRCFGRRPYSRRTPRNRDRRKANALYRPIVREVVLQVQHGFLARLVAQLLERPASVGARVARTAPWRNAASLLHVGVEVSPDSGLVGGWGLWTQGQCRRALRLGVLSGYARPSRPLRSAIACINTSWSRPIGAWSVFVFCAKICAR